MQYAITCIQTDRAVIHPVTVKPLTASAQYSQNESARKIIHNELARIGQSVRCEDRILK